MSHYGSKLGMRIVFCRFSELISRDIGTSNCMKKERFVLNLIICELFRINVGCERKVHEMADQNTEFAYVCCTISRNKAI